MWGVCSRVVRVVGLESLALHCCVFEPRQGLWIISCEDSIQLDYANLMVLLKYPLVFKIIHGGLPPPVKIESRHITFTVSVRRKTQPKERNIIM